MKIIKMLYFKYMEIQELIKKWEQEINKVSSKKNENSKWYDNEWANGRFGAISEFLEDIKQLTTKNTNIESEISKGEILRKHLGQTETEFQDLGKKQTFAAMEEYAQLYHCIPLKGMMNIHVIIITITIMLKWNVTKHYQLIVIGMK
jgi:hypothetical protein